MTSSNTHYVDNERFYKCLVDYDTQCRLAEKEGKNLPSIPDYIALCIDAIARGRAKEYRFSRYPYLEDMIGEAVENCLRYVRSFNVEKGKNPFAYFSQTVYYAFIRKIKSEKKYLYTKFKMTDHVNAMHAASASHASGVGPEGEYGMVKHSDYTQGQIDEFIEKFEEFQNKKKSPS